MLDPVDREEILQRGRAKQINTPNPDDVRRDIIAYARRLRASDDEIQELLRELDLPSGLDD